MQCKNHPEMVAMDRCAGCAEPFCSNCLVAVQGKNYCSACKVMAVSGQPAVEEGTIPCKEAKEALIYGIVSLFCCAIIIGPIAIYKGLQARKMMAMNPRLSGSGKATAGIVLGIVGLVLFVVVMIARLAALANRG